MQEENRQSETCSGHLQRGRETKTTEMRVNEDKMRLKTSRQKNINCNLNQRIV